MGLNALTRNGWLTIPRRQGLVNFIIAIIVIAVFIVVTSLTKGDWVYFLIGSAVVLIWGIISLLLGLLIGKV